MSLKAGNGVVEAKNQFYQDKYEVYEFFLKIPIYPYFLARLSPLYIESRWAV